MKWSSWLTNSRPFTHKVISWVYVSNAKQQLLHHLRDITILPSLTP